MSTVKKVLIICPHFPKRDRAKTFFKELGNILEGAGKVFLPKVKPRLVLRVKTRVSLHVGVVEL